jgi:hypothetical protein
MLIFLDTEFTDFLDIDLISIGLASEDQREFYAERSDFDRATCNHFVHAAVLPILGQDPRAVLTRGQLKEKLLEWLDSFQDHEHVQIGYDYSTDWELFCDALDYEIPRKLSPLLIANHLDQERLQSYFRRPGVKRHHALHDAMANRFAFDPKRDVD